MELDYVKKNKKKKSYMKPFGLKPINVRKPLGGDYCFIFFDY